MIAVLDANIYVSALLKPQGLPGAILQQGLRGRFDIALSENIFFELIQVLNYPKIARRLPGSAKETQEFWDAMRSVAIWTSGELEVARCEDPDDDIYLACAQEANADFLVSGDEHLLKIKNFSGAKIVSARFFWDYLENET